VYEYNEDKYHSRNVTRGTYSENARRTKMWITIQKITKNIHPELYIVRSIKNA